MSERIIRKIGRGHFYLLAFVVGFVLFFLLQVAVMYLGVGIISYKNPNFLKEFQVAVNDYKKMTDQMWGVQNLSQFIGSIILAILMIIIFARNLSQDFQRFKSEWKSTIPMIFLGFIIIYLVNIAFVLIYKLLGVTGTSQNQELILAALDSSTGVFMLLSVMLLAPFVEEILFRKALYGAVQDKFKLRPLIAILISAVIFSALHAVDLFFFQYLPMALVLCTTYSLSKNNILVPIGIHFLNNSTILIYFFMTVFL
jgi:membrane protease YdiL (CAAX protease family)